MRSDHPMEMAVLVSILLAGGLLFVWVIVLTNAIPEEYRSASPGFGWSWDFDYEGAMRDAGRLGEAPWPWPATETGTRLVLPINQTLHSKGLEITYRGTLETGRFQLDVVIASLDAGFTYQRDFDVLEAKRGFTIADRRFTLERIFPRYLLLHASAQ